MKVLQPDSLFRVIFCSILGIVATFYSIGGGYSFPESAGVVHFERSHSPLSYHSNHTHFPFTFHFTLITACAEEEVDEDTQEDEIQGAPVHAAFFVLVSHRTLSKKMILPRLRQAVLNRKGVFLFILYHSWKSFLC
ncbi:hypothetical protein [Haliscomenobacter hydrossis]|uniref:Uncharacterized protein n=1 Tax=Haliscomenobacter hydrossis (strain ATCC 27775 / DSM 1100 / LMG 10767 / O) TaxID=760192 RepID=F4L5A5_HALH1|nr:hypothetical protein [Haliscomenobacter hydrossis]AEE49785.1 hypothetical protein Halhy_1900 [Haliscomenobacter hydrossis DSM 1100]